MYLYNKIFIGLQHTLQSIMRRAPAIYSILVISSYNTIWNIHNKLTSV